MFQQFLQISPAVQNAMNKHVIIDNLIDNSMYFNINFPIVINTYSFKLRWNMPSFRIVRKAEACLLQP